LILSIDVTKTKTMFARLENIKLGKMFED